MELGTFDVDGGHLGIGYDNALGVLAGVELATHGKAGFGGGGRDQLDDHAITDQWLGAPVLADEGEQAVLDFIPLAGAGRQVGDDDVKAELVGFAGWRLAELADGGSGDAIAEAGSAAP